MWLLGKKGVRLKYMKSEDEMFKDKRAGQDVCVNTKERKNLVSIAFDLYV